MVQAGFEGSVLLFARVLYGTILLLQGVSHLRHREAMTDYAAEKAVPAPSLAVAGSGVALGLGGLGVALGVYPTVAAGLMTLFFAFVIPNLQDFWAVPRAASGSEAGYLVKNLKLLAASMAFAILGQHHWPYALNVGL